MIYGRPVGGAGGGATVEYVDYGNDAGITQQAAFIQAAADSLGIARQKSAQVGGYLLFGGGQDAYNNYKTAVVAYDTSLVQSSPAAFAQSKVGHAAVSVGEYALFAGGATSTSGGSGTTVYAYNTALTQSVPTALSWSNPYYLSGTKTRSHALFGGGGRATAVNAYDASLTRTSPAELAGAGYIAMSGSAGEYALFVGLSATGAAGLVACAYDASLTRVELTPLSVGRYGGASANVGDYVLFAGGNTDNSMPFLSAGTAYVDAYDSSLTRSTAASLPIAVSDNGGTSLSGLYALFGGGYTTGTNMPSNGVCAYDKSLTVKTLSALSNNSGCGVCGGEIGSYAVFGGGMVTGNSPTSYRYAQAYRLDPVEIVVPDQCKYAFGGEEEATASGKVTLSLAPPVNGYIKYTNTTIS